MVTVLDGDPGLGKSTLTTDLAARVTSGMPMPGEQSGAPPADVILVGAEDDPAVIVQPRLKAAGADLRRVHLPHIEITPVTLTKEGIEALGASIVEHAAVFVVIDPLTAHVPANVDLHRDDDIRRNVLTPLARVAADTGAAIVIVRHMRKSAGSAVQRGSGSIAIAAAARSVLVVGPDRADPERRILAVSKSNVGRLAPAIAFKIDELGCITWGGEVDVTADELTAIDDGDFEPATARQRAEDALREVLSGGPLPEKVVEERVKDVTGAGKRTIERARRAIGVKSERDGQQWLLSLPDKTASPPLLGAGGVGGVEQPGTNVTDS